MKKLLIEFFNPPARIYVYNKSIDIIQDKLASIFQKKISFWGIRDIRGYFLTNTFFIISPVSFGRRNVIRFSALLRGSIKKGQQGTTIIETKPSTSLGLFLVFFMTFTGGVLGVFIAESNLYLALVSLILGPLVSLLLNHVSNNIIYDRYTRCIHKVLNAE